MGAGRKERSSIRMTVLCAQPQNVSHFGCSLRVEKKMIDGGLRNREKIRLTV